MSININPAHKGLFHKRMGIPQGKPIPPSALITGLNSKNPKEREEANFARNAAKWKK